MDHAALAEELPPLVRLALAYAPRTARRAWLALFALDQRLAAIVRATREPLLGQVRLAWWRDRLTEPCEQWPAGEPVLAALRECPALAGQLLPLVDGWEALLATDDPAAAVVAFAGGRANAWAALAQVSGHPAHREPSAEAGGYWALADLVQHLTVAGGREVAVAELLRRDFPHSKFPRALRPMAILAALAAQVARNPQEQLAVRPAIVLPMIRIGLFGR
jgi:15-cis-phytoene synthase